MGIIFSVTSSRTNDEWLRDLNADWSGDVAAYDKVHDEILQMAHMLTEGIIPSAQRRSNKKPVYKQVGRSRPSANLRAV